MMVWYYCKGCIDLAQQKLGGCGAYPLSGNKVAKNKRVLIMAKLIAEVAAVNGFCDRILRVGIGKILYLFSRSRLSINFAMARLPGRIIVQLPFFGTYLNLTSGFLIRAMVLILAGFLWRAAFLHINDLHLLFMIGSDELGKALIPFLGGTGSNPPSGNPGPSDPALLIAAGDHQPQDSQESSWLVRLMQLPTPTISEEVDGPSHTPAPAAECSTGDSGVQDPLYQKITAKKAELCHLVESLYKEAMVGIGLIEVRECKIENLPEVVKSVVDQYAPGIDNKHLKEMHRYYASLLTRLKKKDRGGLGCEVRNDIRKSIREDLMTGKVRIRAPEPEDDPVD